MICPACGCPGAAIEEAVRMDEELKRPKRLASVSSERQKGVAVLLRQGDLHYVIMDIFLLAGAASLNITELGTDKSIGYCDPELASDAPLLRFKVIGQPLVDFLPIPAAPVKKEPSTLLTPTDQLMASPQIADLAVAALDESESLVAVRAAGTWAPIHGGLIWTGVKPAELRAQIDLLARARESFRKSGLPEIEATALAETNWLTPYLKNQSTEIIQSNPKASEP